MLPCHIYQRSMVEKYGGPVLNVACKEDPARLAETYDAINCDVNDYDPQEQVSLYEIKNFQVGDACDLPFGDHSFDTVVLGEFLEHCPREAALLALREARRVISPGGRIILSFPLDYREKEVQHEPHLLVTWKHGITSWHHAIWTPDRFDPLIAEAGLREVVEDRRDIPYGWCDGVGTVLVRKDA